MRLSGKMEIEFFYLLLVGFKVRKLNTETNMGIIGHQSVLRVHSSHEVFSFRKKERALWEMVTCMLAGV